MNKKYLAIAVLAIVALFMSACNLGTNQAGEVSIEPTPIITQTLGAIQQGDAERSAALTAESAPSAIPTNTLVPTFTATIPASTNTPVPTFTPLPTYTPTEAPFNGIVINDCPDSFMGYHPDSGEKLEFGLLPYVDKKTGLGDYNVICVFEAFSLDQEIKVDFSNGVVAIIADWSHGTYNDDGTIKDACPTGWECEGTWMAKSDIIIPIGTITKIYVYKQEQPARQRFTETISWTDPAPGSMAPFACEYIVKEGHDMRNIRVAAWAVNGKNTIYGFAIPFGLEGHLTCPGYETWNPTPLP